MASNGVEMVTLGDYTVQGSTVWPQTWQWPTYTYVIGQPQPEQDYANEVVVERGEFDATLTFYRVRDGRRLHVKTVTIPLGLLDVIGGADDGE
jgi:hypothetical protein